MLSLPLSAKRSSKPQGHLPPEAVVGDSYSGFFDNGHLADTGLERYLRAKGVDQLFITGLATDYCVKFTALDAISSGFKTVVISDATRAVDLREGDGAAALAELKQRGALISSFAECVG